MDRTTHEMVKKKVASVLKEWNTKMNVDQKDGEMKGELIKETVEDLKRQSELHKCLERLWSQLKLTSPLGVYA